MERLSMLDTNSLNALSGLLRCMGYDGPARVLLCIQGKATRMLEQCKGDELMNYVKTANVTNTKNVLVQVPGWVVKRWGLQQGDKLEVCYNATEDEICIRRPLYTDVQGRSNASQEGGRMG